VDFITGGPDPLFGEGLATHAQGFTVVLQMVRVCGPLTPEMEEKMDVKFPDDDGLATSEGVTDNLEHLPYGTPLQQMLWSECDYMSGSDIRVTTDFLSSMLQNDPKDRVRPKELLCHRWLLEDGRGAPTYPCKCGADH
jgi:hypothetical protein